MQAKEVISVSPELRCGTKCQQVELYRTEVGAVLQCNRQNCYLLNFAGETTAFRVNDFLSFKRKVDSIDLEFMLTDTSPGSDFAVIMPHRVSRCFLLTVEDVLSLRELLDGAKFIIELNCMLHSRLI